jgi:hypothetical protein
MRIGEIADLHKTGMSARCSHCRRTLPIRFTPAAVTALRVLRADAVVLTIDCRWCGERCEVKAATVRGAALAKLAPQPEQKQVMSNAEIER